MKKMAFGNALFFWFVVAVILFFINSFTIKSSFVHSAVLALLGIYLLIFPVYPKQLRIHYNEVVCKRIIRIIAVAEIILSFSIRTSFS